jgi:hypothetical protein
MTMKRQSTRTPRPAGPARQPLRPAAAPAAPPAESPLAGTHADPKAAHDAGGVESVAGEEDPGSALDPPAPPGKG